jgi:hypothetical protein
MKIRKAEAHEKANYHGVYPLFGYVVVPSVIAGVKTRHTVAVEYLGEGPGNPNYESIAPKGMHFGDGLHTLLGSTQADLLERLDIDSLNECTEQCG